MCAPHPGGPHQGPRNAPARSQKVKMLAVVRVVKPHVGMCVEFLDLIKHLLLCVYGAGTANRVHVRGIKRPSI